MNAKPINSSPPQTVYKIRDSASERLGTLFHLLCADVECPVAGEIVGCE